MTDAVKLNSACSAVYEVVSKQHAFVHISASLFQDQIYAHFDHDIIRKAPEQFGLIIAEAVDVAKPYQLVVMFKQMPVLIET